MAYVPWCLVGLETIFFTLSILSGLSVRGKDKQFKSLEVLLCNLYRLFYCLITMLNFSFLSSSSCTSSRALCYSLAIFFVNLILDAADCFPGELLISLEAYPLWLWTSENYVVFIATPCRASTLLVLLNTWLSVFSLYSDATRSLSSFYRSSRSSLCLMDSN